MFWQHPASLKSTPSWSLRNETYRSTNLSKANVASKQQQTIDIATFSKNNGKAITS